MIVVTLYRPTRVGHLQQMVRLDAFHNITVLFSVTAWSLNSVLLSWLFVADFLSEMFVSRDITVWRHDRPRRPDVDLVGESICDEIEIERRVYTYTCFKEAVSSTPAPGDDWKIQLQMMSWPPSKPDIETDWRGRRGGHVDCG